MRSSPGQLSPRPAQRRVGVLVGGSGVAMGWAKSRGPPSERAPEFQFQGQSYKEEEM